MRARPSNPTSNADFPIRCLIAHKYLLFRQGLQRLLEDEADVEVVAQAGNQVETLRLVQQHKPDMVLIDEDIFGAQAEAERMLRKESPKSAVLLLTAQPEQDAPATKAAAGSTITSRHTSIGTSIEELLEMIRSMREENPALEAWPGGATDEAKFTQARGSRHRGLTAREQEILKLLAEGKTVRAVAEILGVSVKTADAHKFNLMRKLGVHNKAELVMCAIQRKAIKVPINF
jgi:two-component system response regulator NreC